MYRINTKIYTDQPFPVTLEAFLVEPLHGDYYSSPGLGSCERMLVDPTLENGTEASLSQYTIGTEVSCGVFQLREAETLYIRGL